MSSDPQLDRIAVRYLALAIGAFLGRLIVSAC